MISELWREKYLCVPFSLAQAGVRTGVGGQTRLCEVGIPLLSSVTLSSLDRSPRDDDIALDSNADMSGMGRRRRDLPLAEVDPVEDSPSLRLTDESIPSAALLLLLRGNRGGPDAALDESSLGVVGVGSRTSMRDGSSLKPGIGEHSSSIGK